MPPVMARILLYCIAALIISANAVVYEDCEVPPLAKNSNIEIEDEEDTIRVIYKCQPGFELRGSSELLCDLDTDEWNGSPPECVPLLETNEVEDKDTDEIDKLKRKKQQDITEDRMVSPALASTLDMSCVHAKIKAPEIKHGYVKKYDRRRRGDKIFLAASYACNDNFEFEYPEINTLYCGQSKWVGELPVCITSDDYSEGDDEEYDDYAEENEEEKAIIPPTQPPTQTQTSSHETKEISNEIPAAEKEVIKYHGISEVTNELEKSSHHDEKQVVTELPSIVEPTEDPYTPRVVDYNCGPDNGGCEQQCERVLFAGENEPRIKCSCSQGFSLDPYDYSACHDIDECAIRNGGCEQLCQNLPGSFQCTCESGLQIDTLTGNTCVDINECELPEIAAECIDGCENTHGSYRCIVSLNHREDLDEESSKTSAEAVGNSNIKIISEVLECSTGYKAKDGKCVDIDECSEGTSGCENCINVEGGYECTCPTGYGLADNGKTCADIDECSIVVGDNEYEASYKICSHGCENTIGSFHCNCPERHHLATDGRTCIVDTCSDLEKPELNKTRCGYDCADLVIGSYQCLCPEGYALTEDGFNCQEVVDVCNDHKDTCSPGTCQSSEDKNSFFCVCPLGYEENDSRCVDIDECSRGTHKCSHECVNTEGNYRCECSNGFRFANGSDYECEDINECAGQEGICGTLNCVNLDGAFTCLCSDGSEPNAEGLCSDMLQNPCKDHQCSHECLIEGNNSFRCACPGNMTLDQTGVNCMEADVCLFNKNGCEQICKSEENGLCGCFDGFVLDGNGKSCIDIDECQINNGGCHQLCTNFAGSYACACEEGFVLADDQQTCLDIDECALGQHDCSHECINIDGGFQCSCPQGYYLGETRAICLDIDECIVTNHGCSHNCYNTQGSYMCACPDGFTISADGKTCYNQRCNTDNGGCSHLCDPVKGCGCPLGWSLGEDGKTCEDIDECLYKNGYCLHQCFNTEGTFECRCPDGSKPANGEDACPIACPAGFTFSTGNPLKCVDIDECSLPGVCEFSCHNTNGSYECLCPNGYRLENGRECVDVDECFENNGGCLGGLCVNRKGGFECTCPLGYILLSDRKTCEKRIEIRDQCSPFEAPVNGEVHCTKYRHKKKRFYNTKCKVWCRQGYHLEGPSQRYCNASGHWDDHENQCLPITCPRIPMPRNGVMLPQSCSLGTTFMGEQCRLKCNVGFVPVGKSVAVCTSHMQWSYDGTFECVPMQEERPLTYTNDFTNSLLPTLQKPPTASTPNTYQTHPLPNVDWKSPKFEGVGVQKPFIKCPRNTTVFLGNDERTAHIILEKPLTNLDYRYIESSPAWTRDLQAHLAPGTYAVVFRGQDPVTGRKARCTTVIHVTHAEGPKVAFCTNSFEVQMAENQAYRSVVWEEPRFESKFGLKKVYKSRIPGELFGIGVHTVFYEATNEDGLTAKCEFQIHVKEAKSFTKPGGWSMNLTPYKADIPMKKNNKLKVIGGQRQAPTVLPSKVSHNVVSPALYSSVTKSQLLAGHDSFIVCPGEKPIKVTHAQTVKLPLNCILKNVRLHPIRQMSPQRLLPRFWNSYY